MEEPQIAEALQRLLADASGPAAKAARYLLAHPEDVAVHSMRALARRAEVPPVTLVRLAQRLGLTGYGELRQRFVDKVLRSGAVAQLAATRNVDSARAIAAARAGEGALAFAEAFFVAEHEVLRRAFSGLTEARLAQSAHLLAHAPRVFVAARRTPFPAAFTLAYALRKARPNVTLLDDAGGAPEAALEDVASGDAFIAFTFAPFSRVTDTLARRAADAGAQLLVVSDVDAAPLRELAGPNFYVAPTFSRAFPESAGGALAIANLLAALAVAALGEAAQKRIRLNERRLVETGEYLLTGKGPRRRG